MGVKHIILFVFLSFGLLLHAEIKVASVLGDNMVLQRNAEVLIWGTAEPDQKICIKAEWNKSNLSIIADNHGSWEAKVGTTNAGGPYTLVISSGKEKITFRNILLGEVWLTSGQSNITMTILGNVDQPVNGSNETLLNADNDHIRLYTVGRAATPNSQDTCTGKWLVATSESVANFSAVGYYFAKEIQRKLNVPVGIICSGWGGTRIQAWMNLESQANFPDQLQNKPIEKVRIQDRASHLYNGMIYPIRKYCIKGILWYQGESNRQEANIYAGLMNSMVASWRKAFNIDELPFYYVQIAPYSYDNSDDILTAVFRDEQLKASFIIPHCGMISTIDIGEKYCIHPAEKETVGKRLSYWALSETYGIKGISYKNPYFKNAIVRDSMMVVSFENVGMGLTNFGKELTNFEVASEDRIFYPAKATILNKQINVYTPEVKHPIAVRYGFYNFPKGGGFLYNTAGLPVPSFRSDTWDK